MLHRSGFGNVTQVFYDVPISHVARSSRDVYTFLINLVHDGVEYAVSFDFGPKQLSELVENCAPPAARADLTRLLGSLKAGTTLQLESPLVARVVEARLGQLQRWDKEEFLPLVVQRVE